MFDVKRPSDDVFSIKLESAHSNHCSLKITIPWEVAEALFIALSDRFDAREIIQSRNAAEDAKQQELREQRIRENQKKGEALLHALNAAKQSGLSTAAAWSQICLDHGIPQFDARTLVKFHRHRVRQHRNARIIQFARDGKTNAEIAEIEGLSAGAVSRIVSKWNRQRQNPVCEGADGQKAAVESGERDD